jgi:Mn2+/Fe2+ NRAMP family transporter
MTPAIEKKTEKKTDSSRLKFSLAQLGPGLLMAGAAIGVSHLVQSTRAGAMYGWGALLFVLLANLMKYPFYEYGHRYAAASGQNLIQAYRQQGRRFFIPFLLISAISAVGSFAVDAYVAAMLVQYLWLPQISETVLAVGVLLFCWALIALGRYRLFEEVTKWCVILLAIATLSATAMAIWVALSSPASLATEPLLTSSTLEVANASSEIVAVTTNAVTANSDRANLFSWAAVPFLVAFMGWMPGGLDLSIWQSLWVQAAGEAKGEATSLSAARFDFNFGYILTVVLAGLFLTLGTLTLPSAGLSNEPAEFSGQLVGMYTQFIGAWAEPIIGLCAMAAIFSTTFTVVDAFPRTLEAGLYELFPSSQHWQFPLRQAIALTLIALAGLILSIFTVGFEPLIDTITIVAFVAAPFYAWLNMRCINTLDEAAQPEPWLARLATVGFVYLAGFSLLFVGLQVMSLWGTV